MPPRKSSCHNRSGKATVKPPAPEIAATTSDEVTTALWLPEQHQHREAVEAERRRQEEKMLR